jgi:hypothetical protein
VATFDESWFYLNMGHELTKFQPIPEREQRIVQSEKVMLPVVWNPSGSHLIKLPPKWFKFNASYYVTQIPDAFSVWNSDPKHESKTHRARR